MKKNILTKNECNIARLLVAGMSAKIISKNLCISLRTVEYYQKRIKAKLGSENAYQTGFKIGIALLGVNRKFNESAESDFTSAG